MPRSRKFAAALTLLIFLPCILNAQEWSSDATEKAVHGISNFASSIISDSFVPMTHYKKGEWTATLVPAYARVSQAYDDPKIESDDMSVYSFGCGAGYAVSNSVMIFGVISAMKARGVLSGEFYGEALPVAGVVECDTDYGLVSLNTGIGYDLCAGSKKWSLPVYAGIFLQRFSLDAVLPEVDEGTYTIQADITGSGALFGVNAGIALSRMILDTVRITPYFLWMRSFNRPKLDGKVVVTPDLMPIPLTHTQTFDTEPVQAQMFGLNCSIMTSDRWSFSVSAGGLLSSLTGFYHEKLHNGLDMVSVVIAITYNGGL